MTLLNFIGLIVAIAIFGYVLVVMSIYLVGLPGGITPYKAYIFAFIAGSVFLIGKFIQLSLRGRQR